MSLQDSVTLWIEELRAGDSLAAQKLWEAYFQRMVELARHKLAGLPRSVADEEDVALSAFKSFCLGARNGRYTQLVDRDNLWPLLVAITANKSVDLIRRLNRQKRGGSGRPAPEQASGVPSIGKRSTGEMISLSDVIADEPSPEFAAELAEQLQRLLDRLQATGDPDLQKIAIWKMEGNTTAEIAASLGVVRRTVERKIQMIQRVWEKEGQR